MKLIKQFTKVRAEVDPEAELIFGAIKDENMTGKMRVSIVATSLNGSKPQTNTSSKRCQEFNIEIMDIQIIYFLKRKQFRK